MIISEGLLESVEEALSVAKQQHIPVLIDGAPPECVWLYPETDDFGLYFKDVPCWVVYPDGTISLLSRDENEVIEARMSLELAR